MKRAGPIILMIAAACSGGSGADEPKGAATKADALARAQRRAYDGAPPVIPHRPVGAACIACHNDVGTAVEGLGFAPPMPHGKTAGLSDTARCRQCHVFKNAEDVFRESSFLGLPQSLAHGGRLHPLAPPVIPHALQLRESCTACHAGGAAREEIRCSHPERRNCLQCHARQAPAGAENEERFTR